MSRKLCFRRPFERQEICTTAALPYLMITVKVTEIDKVSIGDMQNLRTVNILTADDKYYLVNTDNLTQHIQMELSKKQQDSSYFFLHF